MPARGPPLTASAARAAAICGRGGARVGGAGDRAADDEQVGAVGERLLGRRDPRLVLAAAPAGRTPGVMSVMSGPTSARTAATSCGEQTSAPRAGADRQGGQPAHGVQATARRARRGQRRRRRQRGQHRDRGDLRVGRAPRRPRAIIAAPPAACTVR